MARMPGAVWLGEHSPGRPMERYDVVCVHTIVGFAPAHAAHFSVEANGRILQSRDTAFQSGANLEGNPRVIAIENEDHGPAFGSWSGSDVPPLTDEQVESNARILRWAHEEHGIPLQLCPDSRPGSRGLGYHRQGIDGNFADGFAGRVSGGETWTEHFGKVCPGRNRIAQLPTILDLAQGDDMAQYEELLKDIHRQTRRNGMLTYRRDTGIMDALGVVLDVLDGKATKSQARKILAELREQVAAEQPEAEGGDVDPR